MTLIEENRSEALNQSSTGPFALARAIATAAFNIVKYRVKRAAFRRMLTLDDRMLKDVGVTRGDVYWASELPMNINAGEALRRESLKARKSVI
ncbi:MAG: DUF1127 domain-containing protein [Hyphomicrobiales bacterium]